jgi:hypothetical protein
MYRTDILYSIYICVYWNQYIFYIRNIFFEEQKMLPAQRQTGFAVT